MVVFGGVLRYKCDFVNDDVIVYNLVINFWKFVVMLLELCYYYVSMFINEIFVVY